MSEKNFENPEFTNKGPTHNINIVGYKTHMFCPNQYKNRLLYLEKLLFTLGGLLIWSSLTNEIISYIQMYVWAS